MDCLPQEKDQLEKPKSITTKKYTMKFTPKTEKQIAEENVIPDGLYDFEVATSEEKVSKNGNDMIVLNLKVYDVTGRFVFVTDYLLESFLPKLLAFCKEAGLRGSYDDGTLCAEDLPQRTGKVQIAIEQKGDYPAKNVVKWYGEKTKRPEDMPPEQLPPISQRKAVYCATEEDEEIPF